jgi:hypothetical protein
LFNHHELKTCHNEGETSATIHQEVVKQFGKKLAAGVVLFIRHPVVSMIGQMAYMIMVTKKNLVAVVDAVEAWVKKDPAADEGPAADGYGFMESDDTEKKVEVKIISS